MTRCPRCGGPLQSAGAYCPGCRWSMKGQGARRTSATGASVERSIRKRRIHLMKAARHRRVIGSAAASLCPKCGQVMKRDHGHTQEPQ